MSASSMVPGSNRAGVLQTSTAKLNLKEPYYRMTQSPAYAWSQQEQQQQQQVEEFAAPQVMVPFSAANDGQQELQQFSVPNGVPGPQQFQQQQFWAS